MESKFFTRTGLTLALFTLFAIFCTAISISEPQEVECGLSGVRSNSTENNPILLPSIPQNITAGVIIWTTQYFGNIRWADLDPSSDRGYLGGIYTSGGVYELTSTVNTTKFIENENRTIIKYHNRVYCNNGNITYYYFNVPFDL